MPKDKYTNERFWLFPQATNTFDGSTDLDGIPFRGDYDTKRTTIYEPQSNTYKSTTTTIIRTTRQFEFKPFDRISTIAEPSQDDFSIIAQDGVDRKPYMPKGNKYRTRKYWEYTLTIQ